jgi:hypothetical protein
MQVLPNDLIAFRVGSIAMKLIPASPRRDWIEQTMRSFASRCLPMHMANQAGWFLLNDRPFRALWRGGNMPSDIVLERTGQPPYSVLSHFGHGILTFTMPFLFRTPPGTAMLIRGPANSPKDGIVPLEGLVETNWAAATAAMSWKFTRDNVWVEFARDEPISMLVPQRLDLLEAAKPRIVDLDEDPDTRGRYRAWKESRDRFNRAVARGEPEAVAQGWQRHYFQGTSPPIDCDGPIMAPRHRTRLRLRGFART